MKVWAGGAKRETARAKLGDWIPALTDGGLQIVIESIEWLKPDPDEAEQALPITQAQYRGMLQGAIKKGLEEQKTMGGGDNV